MKIGDFYDKVHTTPQGTKRIEEIIYPRLKIFFKKNKLKLASKLLVLYQKR